MLLAEVIWAAGGIVLILALLATGVWVFQGEEEQGELCGGTQQPRQGGDANPPEQKSIRRARDNVVNLADERDVGEKQARADQVQRLAGLPVFALHFAPVLRSRATAEGGQPPATRVEAEHEHETGGNFHAARDVVPVRSNQQRDSRRDEHGADDGDDGEEIAAAVLLELEVFDDFLPLLLRDEAGVVNFFDVGGFHISHALFRLISQPD